MVIARKQTLVQLSDELVELLDRHAASESKSRSAVIRDAIEAHLHDQLEAEIDRRIVDGYTRFPPTEEETAWAEESAIEGIREEPW
jgi:metal-responsive CopG/Arc/MetJ family transcriptional regulator